MGDLLSFTTDPEALNEIVNHPDVRPGVGPIEAGYLDLTPLTGNPNNLFLLGDHGGFALLWSAPHTHEVHTFITQEGRGKWAKQAAAEAIQLMWSRGTHTLWTQIATDTPHVRAFAAAMGMHPTGEQLMTFGKPHSVYCMGAGSCQ